MKTLVGTVKKKTLTLEDPNNSNWITAFVEIGIVAVKLNDGPSWEGSSEPFIDMSLRYKYISGTPKENSFPIGEQITFLVNTQEHPNSLKPCKTNDKGICQCIV